MKCLHRSGLSRMRPWAALCNVRNMKTKPSVRGACVPDRIAYRSLIDSRCCELQRPNIQTASHIPSASGEVKRKRGQRPLSPTGFGPCARTGWFRQCGESRDAHRSIRRQNRGILQGTIAIRKPDAQIGGMAQERPTRIAAPCPKGESSGMIARVEGPARAMPALGLPGLSRR